MLKLYIEHLAAWWRGDLSAITKQFAKTQSRLLAHNAYLTKIADEQAQYSRALAKRSELNYAEAAKAQTTAQNIAKLIGA